MNKSHAILDSFLLNKKCITFILILENLSFFGTYFLNIFIIKIHKYTFLIKLQLMQLME